MNTRERGQRGKTRDREIRFLRGRRQKMRWREEERRQDTREEISRGVDEGKRVTGEERELADDKNGQTDRRLKQE